jgi:hypothetical protein
MIKKLLGDSVMHYYHCSIYIYFKIHISIKVPSGEYELSFVAF